MNTKDRIKAFTTDASGQLVPTTGNSLVLEFPSGKSLEISWDPAHPDDPSPPAVFVWGGRRPPFEDIDDDDIEALKLRTSSLVLMPHAANLVLIRPQADDAHEACDAVPVDQKH